ncbi:hypothetical protein HDV06_006625 [Boothiomyces sp. JEL0866]|nr:hypothetical protein HDV06_006625 [Boothiomyces sp. JEL0866]
MTWFEYWMLTEALFLMIMVGKYNVFKEMSSGHLPKVTDEEFEHIMQEFSNIKDIAGFFSGCKLCLTVGFFNIDPEKITRQDIFEWASGMFFNKKAGDLDLEQFKKIKRFTDMVSSRMPKPLPERSGQPLNKILLTLDTPNIIHRPIVYYCLIRIVDFVCRCLLSMLSFHKKQGELPFYLRSGSSKELPIVFFHGLGIGLTSYLPFVAALAIHYPDRNIILFEMPSITMKLDENHVLPQEYALHVANCLKELGFEKNIIAGHSLGTTCVRWMDLFHPELVHSRLFIDPVCFSLWTHHIAHNALYREPKNFHETFIKFIAMTEPGHATFLHRYFVWFQNTYFTSQLPKNSVIYLSEKDNIVDSPSVAEYLLENYDPSRQLVYIKAFRHGQILASPEVSRVVKEIEALGK